MLKRTFTNATASLAVALLALSSTASAAAVGPRSIAADAIGRPGSVGDKSDRGTDGRSARRARGIAAGLNDAKNSCEPPECSLRHKRTQLRPVRPTALALKCRSKPSMHAAGPGEFQRLRSAAKRRRFAAGGRADHLRADYPCRRKNAVRQCVGRSKPEEPKAIGTEDDYTGFRYLRVQFYGELYENIDYRLEIDLAQNLTVLSSAEPHTAFQDVWTAFHQLPAIGNFRVRIF